MSSRGVAPQLRLGSHNVRGLVSSGRASAAAEAWRRLRFDIVFLQETHLADAVKELKVAKHKTKA